MLVRACQTIIDNGCGEKQGHNSGIPSTATQRRNESTAIVKEDETLEY